MNLAEKFESDLSEAMTSHLAMREKARLAKFDYDMMVARTRLEIKAKNKDEGKHYSNEDVTAQVRLAHEKEPLRGLYLAHVSAMGERDAQEVKVDTLKIKQKNREYEYWNAPQGGKRQ